jgi:soluble lytic murein transglycosylase-like protein
LDLVQPFVRTAVEDYDVSGHLLNAIIVNESKGMQNAVSPTGALGISQLTYGIYGSSAAVKAFGSAINPFVPEQAIDRQAALLSQLSDYYGGDQDKIVAAYNQGQGVVDASIKKYGADWAQHIPQEGQNYIVRINQILSGSHKIPGYFGN